jgi:ATP-binding cassette, subfamily B, multidrug efflux pump
MNLKAFRKADKNALDEISGQRFEDKVLRQLWPLLKPHKSRVLVAMVLVFISAGVALAGPKILGWIVDKALLPKDFKILYQLMGLYAFLELARLCAIWGQSVILQRVGQEVMQTIRGRLFGHLVRMPVPFFDRNPTGRLVTRVTNDTVNLSELFSSSFVMLLSDLLLIIGVMGAMLWINPKLGFVALSVFPLMIFAMVFFGSRLQEAFRVSREVLARLNGFFAERMSGMPVVQLMERERLEQERFRALSQEYRERQFAGVYLYSLFHPTITVLGGASVALILWYGPQEFAKGAIPVGTFITFLAYAQLLYQPVRNITDRYNVFLAAMSSAERIFTLLRMEPEGELATSADGSGWERNTKESFREGGLVGLEFRNVSFRYPGENEASRPLALAGLSLKLEAGQNLAVVGRTGAGKTTLSALLLRFYEPNEGEILLGGRPLHKISKAELRSRVGFVQQEVFLFSGTIKENLVLFRPNATEQELSRAIERTGFSLVLGRMKRGLETRLDERGANLSLGERQILAFARVYLQQPDLLVLDEATSSVDPGAEHILQMAQEELMENRTSVVIAHRLDTIRKAQRILVLEKGHKLEWGTHEELMALGGRYAQYLKLQSAGS